MDHELIERSHFSQNLIPCNYSWQISGFPRLVLSTAQMTYQGIHHWEIADSSQKMEQKLNIHKAKIVVKNMQ